MEEGFKIEFLAGLGQPDHLHCCVYDGRWGRNYTVPWSHSFSFCFVFVLFFGKGWQKEPVKWERGKWLFPKPLLQYLCGSPRVSCSAVPERENPEQRVSNFFCGAHLEIWDAAVSTTTYPFHRRKTGAPQDHHQKKMKEKKYLHPPVNRTHRKTGKLLNIQPEKAPVPQVGCCFLREVEASLVSAKS